MLEEARQETQELGAEAEERLQFFPARFRAFLQGRREVGSEGGQGREPQWATHGLIEIWIGQWTGTGVCTPP